MRPTSPSLNPASTTRLALVVGSGRFVDRQVRQFLEAAPDAMIFTWRRQPAPGRERLDASSWQAVARQLSAAGATHVVHIGVFSPADLFKQLFGALGSSVIKSLHVRGGPIETVLQPYDEALRQAGVQPLSHAAIVPAFLVGQGLLSSGGLENAGRDARHCVERLLPMASQQLSTRQPRFSVSQSIIFEGEALAAQERRGTDALLRAAANRPPKGPRILVKMRPPQQPVGLDPPAIGAKTLHHAAQAGVSGILLDGRHGIVFDREEVLGLAETLGIWLYGH